MITVNVLGDLTVTVVGRLPRKTRALLAFLAMQPDRRASRERLGDLLWPYQETEQARHSLRNCLYDLRKTLPLGAEAIRCDNDTVALDASVYVDADDFLSRSSGSVTELVECCNLYRGDFLGSFQIDSEPWDEWARAQRTALREAAIDRLLSLASLATASGEHAVAVSAAQRLVEMDNLREASHRVLLAAYGAAGRRAELVRHYMQMENLLKRELGVAPDRETVELYRSMFMNEDQLSDPPPDVTWRVDLERQVERLTAEVAKWRSKYEELVGAIRLVKKARLEADHVPPDTVRRDAPHHNGVGQ